MDLLSGKSRINKFTIRKFKEKHRKALEVCEDRRFAFGKFKTLPDLINLKRYDYLIKLEDGKII